MSERGSTLPLIAGLLALVVSVTLGVSALTSLTLERHRLLALAENTALHSADAFSPAALEMTGDGLRAPLRSDEVARRALDFLSRYPQSRHRELRILAADSPDGLRARIVLRSSWVSPLWSDLFTLRIPVTVEVYSRSFFG